MDFIACHKLFAPREFAMYLLEHGEITKSKSSVSALLSVYPFLLALEYASTFDKLECLKVRWNKNLLSALKWRRRIILFSL